MFSHIEQVGEALHLHLAEISLKATKSFTHGGITFDRDAGTVTFGSLPAVTLPTGIVLTKDKEITLRLVAPDGSLRKQIRTGTLSKVKDAEVYRIAGKSKTPANFSAEDGWKNEIYSYRAYYTHPGMITTGFIPEWLQASIDRQRSLWNRLAWLCREARRKSSPVSSEEIKSFVEAEILPAIDKMNDSLGRSRNKLKHPKKLKVEAPQVDGLWKFVGVLRSRVENDLPVPEGLLDSVVAFASQFKADYKPINEFLANVQKIADREARELGLAHYEARPVLQHFFAVLKARKTRNHQWTNGWPLIRYPDSRGANDWSFTYYLGKSGIKSADLEDGRGIPGLHFGPAKSPAETGHPEMIGSRAKRMLREATITVPNKNKELWDFRFAVQQHRPLPPDSHIKQWQLAESGGELWLHLTVELQRPVPTPGDTVAGLDIGWRRTEEGIRIGVLYEPGGETYKEILLDFQKSPVDPTLRKPFQINLGPKRFEKRNIHRLLPDWKPGDPIPGVVELRNVLNTRRSYLKDEAKAKLRKHLGEDSVPAWFDKAGRKGLLHLAEELKDDSQVQEIVSNFDRQTQALNRLAAKYYANSALRIQDGYQQISHDICKHLTEKGVYRIAVEDNFLAKISQKGPKEEGDGYYALKNSQKYRQFAAVGTFVAILKHIASKYGVTVEEVSAVNTTRTCMKCGHENAPTAKQRYQCAGCQRLIDQDHNASVNLSRAAAAPKQDNHAA